MYRLARQRWVRVWRGQRTTCLLTMLASTAETMNDDALSVREEIYKKILVC